MKRIAGLVATGVLIALFSGCSRDENQSAAPVTVTQTATVTTTTSTASPSPSYSESSSAYGSVSSSASVDLNTIRSVKIELESGLFTQKVGDNLFQRSGNYPIAEAPRIRWYSRGENGDILSTDCAVVIELTGPGNTDERYRSGNCTGTIGGWDSADMTEFGQYTVKVSVTSPAGGAPVVETVTYKYIAPGS